MHTATRFPIERYAEIDQAIRSGAYPNANTIAAALEVSPRTIHRDIDRLRNHHGAPIGYDQAKHGYFYTRGDFRLSCAQLTEAELLALFLAERVLQQYRGTPYARQLAAAFSRLTSGLDDRVTIDLTHLGQLQSFRTTSAVDVDAGLFQVLHAALCARHRLELRYWSASSDTESTRLVDPYHMASINGQWYLCAYCHTRHSVRMFVPGRIRSARDTGEVFEEVGKFDVDSYLASAVSVMRGDTARPRLVRLRLTGAAVRFVRGRTLHASQVVEHDDDQCLIMTFQLSHMLEIQRFALAWGDCCEVLDPPELRAEMAETLAKAAGFYLQSGEAPSRHLNRNNGRTPKRRRTPQSRG